MSEVVCKQYGGFLTWGYLQNGGFILENPTREDDFEVPLFQETSNYGISYGYVRFIAGLYMVMCIILCCQLVTSESTKHEQTSLGSGHQKLKARFHSKLPNSETSPSFGFIVFPLFFFSNHSPPGGQWPSSP